MTVAINQKIVQWAVVDESKSAPPVPVAPIPVLAERDQVLSGKTYKLKTPLSEHALYVTINDSDGKPFEIFINSKAMENFQWIVALTRVMSAVFRQGGNVAFLVEELMAVIDPKGGYFYKGQYRASLVAEIGSILREHMTGLGLIVADDSLAVAARQMLAEKQKAKSTDDDPEFDAMIGEETKRRQCGKCGDYSLVVMDGCLTCVSCGDSKCG